jgi:hypothetical protein
MANKRVAKCNSAWRQGKVKTMLFDSKHGPAAAYLARRQRELEGELAEVTLALESLERQIDVKTPKDKKALTAFCRRYMKDGKPHTTEEVAAAAIEAGVLSATANGQVPHGSLLTLLRKGFLVKQKGGPWRLA